MVSRKGKAAEERQPGRVEGCRLLFTAAVQNSKHINDGILYRFKPVGGVRIEDAVTLLVRCAYCGMPVSFFPRFPFYQVHNDDLFLFLLNLEINVQQVNLLLRPRAGYSLLNGQRGCMTWVAIDRGIVVGLTCGDHSSGAVLVTLGRQMHSAFASTYGSKYKSSIGALCEWHDQGVGKNSTTWWFASGPRLRVQACEARRARRPKQRTSRTATITFFVFQALTQFMRMLKH